MEYDEFAQKVRKILGKIKFDGHIRRIFRNIDETRVNDILDWIKSCKNNNEKFEPCKNNPCLVAFIENLGRDLNWV